MGLTQQHLELNKGTKKLGGEMLEAKLGQAPGSFIGCKADGCEGYLGGKEELASSATMWYSLGSLSAEHYYLPSPRLLGAKLDMSCLLFPYLVAAAQRSPVY
ncbi:hypothetical protein Y1Q_0007055 [Alligator mississippiensis]|uniref:Uncharacterized protein n=1 Tax=Alligator mississippiensis TaxID=8496 RepID=A0A151N5G5_ALLMI|nr:hypothetical protein Y1Q_0007055 [Alligator mississippiensis]